MEKNGGGDRLTMAGSRQSNLRKSFEVAIRSLLTCCSNQEFAKAFSSFSTADQASLHRLFIQVVSSLHKMIEDEFESLCLETQVGATLDSLEELVEEQNLDPLFSEKTNVMDVECNLEAMKKDEIRYLTTVLERVEGQNRIIQDRIELLKKGKQDVSGTTVVVKKLRSTISNYGTCNNGIEGAGAGALQMK